MRYYGKIVDDFDMVNKKYVDEHGGGSGPDAYIKSVAVTTDKISFIDQDDTEIKVEGSEYIKIQGGKIVLNIADGDDARY